MFKHFANITRQVPPYLVCKTALWTSLKTIECEVQMVLLGVLHGLLKEIASHTSSP